MSLIRVHNKGWAKTGLKLACTRGLVALRQQARVVTGLLTYGSCLFALSGLVACHGEREAASTGSGPALTVTASADQSASAAWLEQVRRAHELSDAVALTGATEEAVDALQSALRTAPAPRDVRERWVVQDVCFRLAQLAMERQNPNEAMQWVNRGLQEDNQAQTLARANLLALQGKVFEAQGERERAAEAYHQALLINEVLMDAALRGQNAEQ